MHECPADARSNEARNLIEQKKWDEALLIYGDLCERFPDAHDGFELSAKLHDAMGHYALAADFWRRAIEFVEHPDQRPHYDQEVLDEFREHMERSLARAPEANVP